MSTMRRLLSSSEVWTGLIFVAIGLVFGVTALVDLDIGAPDHMGPGFVPLYLAGALVVVGLAIGVAGLRSASSEPMPKMPWRGAGFVFGGFAAFALTADGLGLAIAIALAVFVASFASRRITLRLAIPLAIGLAAFCCLVFVVLLDLPIPLVGPWLGVEG